MDPLFSVNLFSHDECKAIVELSGRGKWRSARSGSYREAHIAARQLMLASTHEARWICDRLLSAMLEANQHLKLELEEASIGAVFDDACLFEYTSGGHFGWHVDNDLRAGSQRKLSIVVQLSDPSDYEGGDLEFLPGGAQQIHRLRGCGIIFASYRCHRVSLLKTGVRHSLAAGLFGPPLR